MFSLMRSASARAFALLHPTDGLDAKKDATPKDPLIYPKDNPYYYYTDSNLHYMGTIDIPYCACLYVHIHHPIVRVLKYEAGIRVETSARYFMHGGEFIKVDKTTFAAHIGAARAPPRRFHVGVQCSLLRHSL